MSLYENLGVSPDADIDQINAAFRRAAKAHHPDVGGDPATFAELQRAVAVLRDPERRARYDATGDDSDRPNNAAGVAIGMLISAFQEAINLADDPATFDVIAQTRAVLDQRLNNLKANRSGALAEQRKVAKAINRLGFKGDGPNVIGGMLEAKADQVGKALAQMDEAEAAIAAAHELAQAYSWEVEMPPVQAGFTAFFPNASTTATGWR